MAGDERQITDVLDFWFSPESEKRWFQSTPDFDRTITERFGALHGEAHAGRLDGWAQTAPGALALILLLDQFPRNMFRGTPRAFESDAKALAIARSALERGQDRERPVAERPFFYLPLEHSEDLADQEDCVRLNDTLRYEDYLDYAIQHRDIIARFGRFPHRNHILGRANTAEEAEFLKTHKGF
jgi:uncharacterized protein (DUF924 family)